MTSTLSPVLSPHTKELRLKKLQDLESVPAASIKYSDFEPARVDYLVFLAQSAYVNKTKGEILNFNEAAEMIKKEFDTKYGQTWHCIVGTNFL